LNKIKQTSTTGSINSCRCRQILLKLLALALSIAVIALEIMLPGDVWGYYYFGKNKVQYQSLDWQVIKTTNVNIYFYPQEKWLAERTAQLLTTIIPELSVDLNHSLTSKIPLIIYSSHHFFQETNIIPFILPESVGGVTEFFKGRVIVPFDGSLTRFTSTLTHEIVHYFTLNKIKWVMRSRGKFYFPMPPLWYMEGISEYYSSKWDSEADMVLADALLSGDFVPLEHIEQSYGSYLVYKEGQSLISYIARNYGEDKIPALLDNIWMNDDFNKVVEYTLGVDIATLSRGWEEELRKHYLPLVAEHNEPKSAADSLAVSDGLDVSSEVYALNGENYLAYVSNRNGFTNIYSGKLEESESGNGNLQLKDVECIVAGERTPQLESLHIFRSALSVNSLGEMAFVSKSGASDVLNIMDLKDKSIVESYRFENLVGISSPSFSQNDDRLVFSGQNLSGQVDIYLLNRENGELTALTDDLNDDRDPKLFPDGKSIVFSREEKTADGEVVYNLFLLEFFPDGKINSVRQLTQGDWQDLQPRPIGEDKLLFTSDRNGQYNIYTTDLISGEIFQNTDLTTGAFEPTLTSDGKTLICDIYNQGRFSIFSLPYQSKLLGTETVAAVNNGGLEKIPKTTSEEEYPSEKYRSEYSLDIVQAEVAYSPELENSAGAFIAFTDIFNNKQIGITFSDSAETVGDFFSNINIGVSYYNLSHRLNYGLGGFHYFNKYYDWDLGYLYSERKYGATFLASYPFSRYYRIETGVNLYGFKRYFFDQPLKNGLGLSNYISFVKDTSLWNSVGPIDGVRYNLTVSQTSDITRRNFQYYLFSCDLRRYIRLGQQSCYALRLIFQGTGGPDALPLSMGGSLSMRGYKYHDFLGEKLFMFNQELRFPILNRIVLNTPLGTADMGSLAGALFFDVGEAWSEKLPGLRGDFGLSLRWGLFDIFVFRLDIAKKTDFESISHDTPVRFFVGWNY